MSLNPPKEKDIFRDSYLRYLGYTNEVGESFRPLVHKHIVNASYGIAIAYVLADAYDKSSRVYRRPVGGGPTKAAIMASDVFFWQMLASVIIPGFTINRVTWLAGRMVKYGKLKGTYKKVIPTCVGLLSIPIIIKPIDKLVDYLMDKTFRKFVKN